MNFGQANDLLLQGKRVRRSLWREDPGVYGEYLELVQPPPLPDGRGFRRQLMVWWCGELVPWGGVHADVPAGDWEEVP